MQFKLNLKSYPLSWLQNKQVDVKMDIKDVYRVDKMKYLNALKALIYGMECVIQEALVKVIEKLIAIKWDYPIPFVTSSSTVLCIFIDRIMQFDWIRLKWMTYRHASSLLKMDHSPSRME